MTGSGGASTSGSTIAFVVQGPPGIRNMYSPRSMSMALTTTATTTTTSTGPRSFVVPIADLIKFKYEKKNENREFKKEEAKLKEEDDNEAMLQSTMISANQYPTKTVDRSSSLGCSADQACFVAGRSAVKANAFPLHAYSEKTPLCTISHDDFVTSVPAVKANAFPIVRL